jgi:hypothetical protein
LLALLSNRPQSEGEPTSSVPPRLWPQLRDGDIHEDILVPYCRLSERERGEVALPVAPTRPRTQLSQVFEKELELELKKC